MVSDTEIIDDGVPKVGLSNEKMQYGSIANEEAIPLVGERKDDHVEDLSEKKSGLSRLGLAGFLVLALALSSALSMFLVNRSEETGVTAEGGLMWSSASSSSTSKGTMLYTESGFSGGTGHPIFVVEGSKTCPPSILEKINKEARILGAYIIFGDYGTDVLGTIADVRKEHRCSPNMSDAEYCLVVTIDCGSTADSLVTISTIDDANQKQKFDEVDYADPTGDQLMADTIEDTTQVFDLLARPQIASDGPLKQPYEMKTVKLKSLMEGRKGTCPGADWTKLLESDPDVEVYHLTIETGIHKTVADARGEFQTRLMNGLVFGPRIRVSPGDTVRVVFDNLLEDIDGLDYVEGCDNVYCKPNYSNLHYHGGHINGDEPSDDVELSIPPGGCYHYESKFPEYHMPGSHWIHPHFHGNSALTLNGGAAMPFIVEDHENFPLPPEVRSATDTERDVTIFVTQMNYPKIIDIIRKTYLDPDRGVNEDYFQFKPNDGFNIFKFVNGQYMPSLNIETGTWYRFRVASAGWDSAPIGLDWQIKEAGCEQYLLAKDGIYIKDYPRKLDVFPIPTSGRADIMFRCTKPGQYTVLSSYRDAEEIPLMTIVSKGDLDVTKPLENPTEFGDKWQFPAYLDDFVDVPPGDGCSCLTKVWKRGYKKDSFIHHIKLGEVIERRLEAIQNHPYHQHVYPFQLTEGFHEAGGNEYFQKGDWHDVIRVAPEFRPDGFTNPHPRIKFNASATHEGKMMFHCHRLDHEDLGMMNKEHIRAHHPCQCDVGSWD